MSDSLNPKKIKIAIVAGEKSGDELGGPLMESLKQHFQDISFIGNGQGLPCCISIILSECVKRIDSSALQLFSCRNAIYNCQYL